MAKIIAANMDPEIEHPEVYDFACGSGSLLLTVEEELQIPGSQKRRRVRYYGQELNTTNYNMARMNLMMHGVDYQMMDLRNADTLENDWPDGVGNDNIDHPHFLMRLLPILHILPVGIIQPIKLKMRALRTMDWLRRQKRTMHSCCMVCTI